MKKIRFMMIAVLSIIVLAACTSADDDSQGETNNDQNEETELQDDSMTDDTGDEQTDNQPNEDDTTTTGDIEQNDDKNEKMKEIDIAEFELEVEYADHQEYEAEIEKRSNGDYEAELEDDLTDKHLKGDEAFDHLYTLLENVNVNPDSSKEDTIESFLKAFDLDENYEEFEVEITFQDGTVLEYEDK